MEYYYQIQVSAIKLSILLMFVCIFIPRVSNCGWFCPFGDMITRTRIGFRFCFSVKFFEYRVFAEKDWKKKWISKKNRRCSWLDVVSPNKFQCSVTLFCFIYIVVFPRRWAFFTIYWSHGFRARVRCSHSVNKNFVYKTNEKRNAKEWKS